jgi:hypothetical protein
MCAVPKVEDVRGWDVAYRLAEITTSFIRIT